MNKEDFKTPRMDSMVTVSAKIPAWLKKWVDDNDINIGMALRKTLVDVYQKEISAKEIRKRAKYYSK